ncbi:MAG: DUF1080 domain-containing protein [Candidatus Poribacteria bacterium]|nr:DUF1080 domain-containing protein [Candidatus Poribacteria bacterium]
MKLVVIASIVFLAAFSTRAGTYLENFDNGNLDAWQELILTQDFLFLDVDDPPPGSWEIVNGELHAVSPDESTRLLTIGDETWRDYTIEFDVKPLEKPGPSNIAIAARIKESWVVWCLIGDLPGFRKNASEALFAAGNFHDRNTIFYTHAELHRSLKLKKWSKLKLAVEENTLNFWINGKLVIGPVRLPNRKTFERFEAVKKAHPPNPGNIKIFHPLQLDGFHDFLTGAAGLGLSNQTARFDNVVITGDSIPENAGLSVDPKTKLATMWGSLKRF